MKFSTSIIVIAAALFSSTEACQCHTSNGVDVTATLNCCVEAGGSPVDGNQCPAGEISNNLSTFAGCCDSYGDHTDCHCSIGCDVELTALNARGRVPPSDREVYAILAKYAE
ncbi:hypothetical protein ACQKWADRAFT_286978 [Trichoderma austrokoningii]